MRAALVALVAALVGLFPACSPAGDGTAGRRPTDLAERWRQDVAEPYPFSGEVPPLEPTPVDGLYVRHVPLADVGPPVHCRRCPPYNIYAGEARLRLERGRFQVEEDASSFASEGHYVVEGANITFFNDPICPGERVTYEYHLGDEVLTFAVGRDPCAFQNLRGKYLTIYPWTARPAADEP